MKNEGKSTNGWVLILFLSWQFFLPANIQADDTPAAKLHALFAAQWQRWLRDHPDMASVFGFKGYNDSWPDLSLKAFEVRQRHRRQVLQELKAIPFDRLSKADQLNYTLFCREIDMDIEGYRFGNYLLPLNPMEGIQDVTVVLNSLPFPTRKDYEDWLTRMRRFPEYMDQTIALMKEGIRRGRVQPRMAMQRVPAQVRRLLVDDPEKSLFFKPFRRIPEDWPALQQERLLREGREAVADKVLPSYRKLLKFLEETYLPACYDGVGIWHLPGGKEWYAYQARHHTTTSLTPEQIHEIGLKEVRRIRGEMDQIIRKVGFQGTFKEFVAGLRTNPKFYYQKPEDLMAATRAVCKRIEAGLPKLFGRLPRTPFLIETVPAAMAPEAPMGYYVWPSGDGRRPGSYQVNLYRPETRPKYQIEVLSLHEAVPGHHLQISLAFEQDNLPAFRRFSLGYTAFVEGWALYSEGLGEQLGMYQDPYSKFGQLDFAIWRAVRLVVDTGMHAKKWTRDRAIAYALANSAFSRHSIETEIDRYTCWPGQALAYKIGELKIKELRNRAEQKLADRFDVRAFHDMLLGSGALPLDVLQRRVEEWIKEQGREKG